MQNSLAGIKGRTKDQKEKNEPLTPIENICKSTHTSMHKTKREHLPYLAFIAKNNPQELETKTTPEFISSLQKL
jgi:hypothetical protein